MLTDPLFDQLTRLAQWTDGTHRAPHKPLLVLLALARYQQTGTRGIIFADIEEPLRHLLDDFSPKRVGRNQPELPFWHLQSDGIWSVMPQHGDLPLGANGKRPTLQALRGTGAMGAFADAVYDRLDRDPAFLPTVAQTLLDQQFPDTYHADLCATIGLDLGDATGLVVVRRRPRDPAFRRLVLRAYGYQCAICGFALRADDQVLGLEAAHVQWHQAGGPDEVENGLCLCVLHHHLFDRGAFAILPDRRLAIANAVHGHSRADALERWRDQPIVTPVQGKPISEKYRAWHVREVFVGYDPGSHTD